MQDSKKAYLLQAYRGLGRASLTRAEMIHADALSQEQMARDRLDHIGNETDGGVTARLILADALFFQGRYDEAISIAQHSSLSGNAEAVTKITNAQQFKILRDKPDNFLCDCHLSYSSEVRSAFREVLQGRAKVSSQLCEIWSETHNAFVYHTYCQVCGAANISPEYL